MRQFSAIECEVIYVLHPLILFFDSQKAIDKFKILYSNMHICH